MTRSAILMRPAPACCPTIPVPAPARCRRRLGFVDGRKRIVLDDFVACGGAKAMDIPGHVTALDTDTDLVTVSVGGNDISWIEAVATCILADEATCKGAVNRSRTAVVQSLPGLLDTVYSSIDRAAPNARVLVTGYARLFSPEYGDYVTPYGTVTAAEQQLMNDGADLLNSVIAARAAAH
ncbi:GDSL-type esterase/lipase family protein, partial [Nostocoides australiense]|nr:GDSL-type esterase/lipase family protein [Tetrasphaera australiensis]